MKRITLVLAVLYLFNSCNRSISYEENMSNGLKTSGVNLTCEDVDVYLDDAVSESNTYIYGSAISIKFSGVMGFQSVNGRVFPEMKILITDASGKKVYAIDDLYADEKNGFEESTTLNLIADVVLANPLVSGEKYQVKVSIRDKKGDGKFTAEYPLTLESNEKITIESNGGQLGMDEVYLFSETTQKGITDNVLTAGEKVHVFIEGMLENFTEDEGVISIGMSLLITDADGELVGENPDLFSSYDETGISLEDLGEKLSASFIVPDASKGPIHVTLEIWDKFVPEESVTINFDAEIE